MADEPIVTEKEEEFVPDAATKEMIDAGLFFGRTRSKTHPRMRKYIAGTRNEVEIIDLVKTQETMDTAIAFLQGIIEKGGTMLFVATQPIARGLIDAAKDLGYSFVDLRWLGGTLTNFRIVSARVEHLKKLEADAASGALEKYTKKERLEIDRERQKLEEAMGGLRGMAGLPNVLVTVDANLHMTAVREARKLGIPVVALINTDTDPDLVTYPVPGNNKSRMSISWFVDRLKAAIASAPKPKAEPAK